MATLMEFKKKEIAKPYQVDNALRAKEENDIDTASMTSTIENNHIKSVYTRITSNYYHTFFFAYKAKFSISSDFMKYHDMYMDVKIKPIIPYHQTPSDFTGNMFVGINCLNGTFDFSTNKIAWATTDATKSFKPELSNVGRARYFYNYQAIIDGIDPLNYTTKLTDSMIEEIIKNNGEVWIYVMSGDADVIADRRRGTGEFGKIHTLILNGKVGDYTTIEISPIYTYPNYEGSIEEGSQVVYKNPSIIRDIKHNLPEIADDGEINRRIIATYPTMMYLYDTAGDMAELNTTIIQNCADENRETAQALYETTMYEYNPIENYSMTEDGNHTLDGSSNTTNVNTETSNYENCEGHKERGNNRIDSSSDGSNNANGKSDSEATKQQFGYNSENPTDVEKSISKADTDNISKTLTRDGSVGSSNNVSCTHGKSETKSKTNGTENRINNESGLTHLTRKGNIGVTTTQQMIQQEREVILDVLDWYVAKFIKCFKWGAI